MRILKNIVVTVGLGVFLTGCGLFNMPELGKAYNADGELKLLPKTQWNVSDNHHSLLWTKHGPFLDRLDVFAGIEEGDELVSIWGKENPHVFKKDMTALEIVELYKDSLTFSGGINVEMNDVEPATVASQKGFAFTFSFRTADGLKKKGMARGTVHNEQLYLMAFTAPSLHYFDLVREDAVALMDSAHFPENKEVAKK
jgi:hypothetical protein